MMQGRNYFNLNKKAESQKVVGYKISRLYEHIDTIEDFEVAEKLFKLFTRRIDNLSYMNFGTSNLRFLLPKN